MLAVSCGDQDVSMWKQMIDGKWKRVGDVTSTTGQ